jgi:hypothetical protein
MSNRLEPARVFSGGAYARWTDTTAAAAVRESPAADGAGEPDERHLQCVWFDPAFRPTGLRTHTGEDVVVEHPGRWNLEAGPDFLQAAFRIGPDRRRLSGDVEIHIHAQDWVRHGHDADPRYAGVKAHVTYYPASLPAGRLPAGAIQISLRESLAARPSFSFENVDSAAYPHAARAGAGRCQAVLLAWPAAQRAAFLEAAGAERLARKTGRLAAAAAARGPDQALYEDVLGALGYKHNRAPFRALAARLPVQVLREESGLNPLRAYALLSGLAGLLPPQMDRRWDRETRAWVRQVWDAWWSAGARWAPQALDRGAWRLAGLRPPNRPERRLMAAACLFTQPQSFREQVEALRPGQSDFWDRGLALLENHPAPPSYWNRHWSIGGPRTAVPVALLGRRRAAALLANVLLPFLAASGRPEALDLDLLRRLPAEEDNSLIRQTAHDLFGPDHTPALYRSGLKQQGLLHVFHAYCLGDKSGCRNCPLPDMLAGLDPADTRKTAQLPRSTTPPG